MSNFSKSWFAFPITVIAALVACERPSAPNFTLETKVTVPVIKEITYEFLGGSNALIDTTGSDFEDLFLIDGDGMIRISQEVEFDIGEFDSAIPELEIDPISIESEIGDIEVDDFSSEFASTIGDLELDGESSDPENAEIGTFRAEFSGSGSASFEDVTGLDPNILSAGSPISGGNSPDIDVELDVDAFQQAVIESGGMQITFRNELGFEIQTLIATLLSGGNPITGTEVTSNISHNQTATINFQFDEDDVIAVPLAVRLQVEWVAQNMAANPGDLIVQEAADDNLIVKSATADIPSQVINPDTPDLEIDNENFQFAIAANTGDPDKNKITVSLTNNTELPLTNGVFNTLPTMVLRNNDGDVIDQVRVFAIDGSPGATSIGQGQTGTAIFDLDGQKLTKILSYTIDAGTPGGNSLTVNSTDVLTIQSSTSDLVLIAANSDIDPQTGIELSDAAQVEGDFVNAQVDQGTLSITFTNDTNIPLTIDQLTFVNVEAFKAKNTGTFFASGSEIGQINSLDIPANSSVVEVIDISGRGISNNIRYDGTASSPGTTVPVFVTSSDEIRTAIEGSVSLKSATSILDPQDFFTSGVIDIDADEFSLSSQNHYVEIKSGVLNFISIENGIDLDVDSLIIEFPEIRSPLNNYHPDSKLVIRFEGENRIRRSSDNMPAQLLIDLADYRIYAFNNEINYEVRAYTENTRDTADPERVVNATDQLITNVEIQDLKIKAAVGSVKPRTIRLNSEPETGDRTLDLFNEEVVQLTDISDLEELSKRISDIKFFSPSLNLSYQTNIGVDTEIYAAILGVSAQGTEIYLTGSAGSPFQVTSNDTVSGFFAAGAPLPPSDLVKFKISGAQTIGDTTPLTSISFDADNSNVEDFLSNLPTSIRFIGKALVNPDDSDGFVVEPIEFTTNMGLDVPLNFATPTNPGVSRDTIATSLSGLPGEGDGNQLKSARFILTYENGLPLELNISMTFLDEDMNYITEMPLPTNINDGPYIIEAATVDASSRFVTEANRGAITFVINEDQAKNLNRTEHIALRIEFNSTNNAEVKLRATDTFKIGLNVEVSNLVRVN